MRLGGLCLERLPGPGFGICRSRFDKASARRDITEERARAEGRVLKGRFRHRAEKFHSTSTIPWTLKSEVSRRPMRVRRAATLGYLRTQAGLHTALTLTGRCKQRGTTAAGLNSASCPAGWYGNLGGAHMLEGFAPF